MFVKKETNDNYDATKYMNQFAVQFTDGRNLENNLKLLNEWCYKNNCVPVSICTQAITVTAIVRRN